MFEIISAFLISIGINPSHLIAGIAGGVARMLVQGKRLTWEVFSGSLVGTFCAIYLTPVIGSWANLNMADISVNNAVAFGIGIIGLSLTEGLVKLAQRWAANPKIPTTPTLDAIRDATDEKQDEDK